MSATATRTPAAPAPVVPAGAGALAGTGTLVRFMLRRDRVRIPVWIGAIAGFTVLSAASLPGVYLEDADRQVRAELMANPGTAAVTGPGYGLDDYTFGAMIANELLSWSAIFVALMSLLLMVRHTRAEEETGRAELVRAAVVGRHAHTTAALVVVGGASLVLGALTGLGLGSLGLESVSWGSSLLFGAGLAGIGVVFAAVAAVTAQVSQHARGAGGLAGAALAVAYLLRAAGDMSAVDQPGAGTLSWLSPIGWAQQTRVYVDDRWWPLLLPVLLAAALVTLAYGLSSRRDVGAGLVEPRPGKPVAPRSLASPLGLAWRLHRSGLLWWGVALFLFSLGYGSLVAEVEDFVSEMSAVQDWISGAGDSLIEGFLAVVVQLWATAVAVFGVLAMLRLRSEESAGRVEPLLATAVSRTRWVASHLLVSLGGSAVLLALSGLGLGLTAGAAMDDAGLTVRLVGAAVAHLPAVALTVGLGVALFGLAPRATVLVWLVIAYSAVIVNFLTLLGLPDWTGNLSPFGHVPMLPAEPVRWTPLVLLSLVAAALIALGLAGFRRRDLETK